MFRVIVLIVCSMAMIWLAGCGDLTKSSGEDTPTWDEREALISEDALMGMDYASEMNDWQTVAEMAAAPEFKQIVDEFEQAPMPSAVSDKEQTKTELVKTLRDLIAAGESKSGKDKLEPLLKAALEGQGNLNPE